MYFCRKIFVLGMEKYFFNFPWVKTRGYEIGRRYVPTVKTMGYEIGRRYATS